MMQSQPEARRGAAAPTPPARLEALYRAGQEAAVSHKYETSGRLFLAALEIARQQRDLAVYLRVGRATVRGLGAPHQLATKRLIAREIFDLPRGEVEAVDLSLFLVYAYGSFLEEGDRERADRALDELEVLQGRPQAMAALNGLYGSLMRAFIDGDLHKTAAGEEALLALGERVDLPSFGLSLARRLPSQALLYLGRGEEALGLVQGPGEYAVFRRLYLMAHLGRTDEAKGLLSEFMARYRKDYEQREASTSMLAALLEAAIQVEMKDYVVFFRDLLAPARDSAITTFYGFYPPASPPRVLGSAAALLGEFPKARWLYEESLRLTQRVRSRPETAITQLKLGELLLAQYPAEHAAALTLIEESIAAFRSMGMSPFLQRANVLAAR